MQRAALGTARQNPAPYAEHLASASATSALGALPGINIMPGHEDDGWVSPPPAVLSDGTNIRLYKDGEALHAAYEAIASARRRICLELYMFRSDATGRAFADLLCRKARDGVLVFVLYDSFGCLDTDRAMFRSLADAGVRVACFHPIRPWECRFGWRPFNRDHRKLLVVDDHLAWLGGLNIGDEYAGSWVVRRRGTLVPWRDNAVSLRGPAARLLLRAFARMWHYVQHGGAIARAAMIELSDRAELGILASVPTRHGPLGPLRRLVNQARRDIALTMSYFAPPDVLVDDLCRAAGRGVRVRLMLPGRSDVRVLRWAARAFYERMLAAGIEIHERLAAVLHAKTLCIDGHTVVIGSTNLDYRSIEYNCELSLIVRNADFGCQTCALFDNDVRFARRITLREWRRRPLLDRLIQWAVIRARRIL